MRSTLNSKLTKVVRNYNAKITRLSKINPSLALPEKTSVRKIKQESGNRQEILRTLNALKRFSKRGVEETVILPTGELVSKYELNELKRESARLKRNLTKRINTLASTKPKVAGIEQDYTYAEMGDMRLNNMIAKRNALRSFDKSLGKTTSVKDYMKFLTKTRNKQNYQIDIFKSNYLDKMLFSQAYFIGYDDEKIKVIKDKLGNLSNKDFLKAFDNEKLIQMIRDMYQDLTKTGNYFIFEEQLTNVYDELYNNIDNIVSDYSSA
ncbi:MAG: hypothetical protein VZR33_05740 [Methanosphaera sp.]|nr:hypothetical protein [Methanosphaera sp.]